MLAGVSRALGRLPAVASVSDPMGPEGPKQCLSWCQVVIRAERLDPPVQGVVFDMDGTLTMPGHAMHARPCPEHMHAWRGM